MPPNHLAPPATARRTIESFASIEQHEASPEHQKARKAHTRKRLPRSQPRREHHRARPMDRHNQRGYKSPEAARCGPEHPCAGHASFMLAPCHQPSIALCPHCRPPSLTDFLLKGSNGSRFLCRHFG